ncbi:MAG TPA: DUF4412 domain-containing protein, partial [Gemmatimonadaceae bacterium]
MSAIGAVAFASVAFAPQAQAQFEGTITMHMNSQRGTGEDMVWSIKNNRARMDINSGRAVMYMLRQGDKATIVMPQQKMYVEQSIPATLAQATKNGSVKTGDVEVTGKKETIAGYECEHVITTDEQGGKYDVCLAKGLGTFMMPSNPMGRGASDNGPMAAIMRKLDGATFPLRVQKVGSAAPELEVTKIDKKSLDDSMFSVPTDFKKFDMG